VLRDQPTQRIHLQQQTQLAPEIEASVACGRVISPMVASSLVVNRGILTTHLAVSNS
jgi:hypothetical protein